MRIKCQLKQFHSLVPQDDWLFLGTERCSLLWQLTRCISFLLLGGSC